ncbi:MAG TPA: YggT family protein [Gemmatimonadaceae bacterium]|nr:YggT family protein [Gemmatimonadaceae bacterium]
MTDPNVANDEARQAAQREAVKSTIQSHVNREITHQAADTAAGDKAKVDAVATQFRDKAIDETVRTDRALGHARTAARSSQFLDYAFYVLYSLLAIRLVLALIAARSSNGFVQFIGAITGPFYAPFRGIVGSPSAGGSTLVVPIVIALVVYVLLHAGINGALRMVAHRKTEI